MFHEVGDEIGMSGDRTDLHPLTIECCGTQHDDVAHRGGRVPIGFGSIGHEVYIA